MEILGLSTKTKCASYGQAVLLICLIWTATSCEQHLKQRKAKLWCAMDSTGLHEVLLILLEDQAATMGFKSLKLLASGKESPHIMQEAETVRWQRRKDCDADKSILHYNYRQKVQRNKIGIRSIIIKGAKVEA